MNQSIAAYVWLFLLFCYCALIYYLSDQSYLPVPGVFDWLADATGAFLLTIALYKREFVVLRHN